MRRWRSKTNTCHQHIKLAIRFQSANLSQLQRSDMIVEKKSEMIPRASEKRFDD